MPQETATDAVDFRKDGGLFQIIDGQAVKVAHFDRKSGHLEFETAEYSTKLIRKVTAAIGTIDKGLKPSGLQIVSMGVKGQERDKPPGNVPAKPKRDKNYGDQTPELVEWYFKYYPREAYIRYGVYLDEQGNPIRRSVRRKTTEIIDDRSGDQGIEKQNENKGAQVGPKKWENGPIQQGVTLVTISDQIIARRATHMTYAPIEVVGGFEFSDDDGDENEANEEGAE